MRLPIAFAASALLVSLTAARAPEEALYLPPLDPSVVDLDSSLRSETLEHLDDASPRAARGASAQARAARAFYPVFGAAVARAARKVEVIDSSAGTFAPPARRLLLRRGPGDSTAYPLPAPTADSARFTLVVGALRVTELHENLPRRFVPPKEPEFDPTTGVLDPGHRRGYAEGPGLFTHLQARAEWLVWDARLGAVAHRGTASGLATVRGEPARAQWEELARDLAKGVLRSTPFSPW